MAEAQHKAFVDDGYDSDVCDEQDELADTTTTPVAVKHVTSDVKLTKKSSTSIWHVSCKLDHLGGTLRNCLSEDYLEIPRGAIPGGQEWTIYGNIHTELDTFDHLLNKSKGERFAAAISEYEVEGGHWFLKPVAVVIHHSLTNNASKLDKLTVQLHSERHGFIEVPRDKRVDEKGPWFEVDGSTITVYTYHFTNIICKLCDSEECSVKAIRGMVLGKITTDAENNFFAMMEVYLHLVRNVEKLPVFSEVFCQEQDSTGCKLLKAKMFPPSLRQIAPADKISVNLHCTQADWNLLEDSDFREKEIIVEDHVPCLMEAYDPVCLGTYLLKGSAPILNGNITLKIGHNTVKLPVTLATTVDERQVAIPPADWILQDTTLYTIAKTLKHETWFEVGLKLGLTANELAHLEVCNLNEADERKTFQMLRKWLDKQLRNGNQELQSIETLRHVLGETGNRCALELLEQSWNLKSESETNGTSKSGKVSTFSDHVSVLGPSADLHNARDQVVTCYHVTKDHDQVLTDSVPNQDQDQINAATPGNELTTTANHYLLVALNQNPTVAPHQDQDSILTQDQDLTTISCWNPSITSDQNSSVTPNQDRDPITTSDQNPTVASDQDQNLIVAPDQDPNVDRDQGPDSTTTTQDHNLTVTSGLNQVEPVAADEVALVAANEVAPATAHQVHSVTQEAVSTPETKQQLSQYVLHKNHNKRKITEQLTLRCIAAHLQKKAKWSQPMVVNIYNGPTVAEAAREREVAIPAEKWKILTPANLYKIAEAMLLDTFYEVGVNLDLDLPTINDIRAEYKKEPSAVRFLQILGKWIQQCSADPESDLLEKLRDVLRFTSNWTALNKIERLVGANNVPDRRFLASST